MQPHPPTGTRTASSGPAHRQFTSGPPPSPNPTTRIANELPTTPSPYPTNTNNRNLSPVHSSVNSSVQLAALLPHAVPPRDDDETAASVPPRISVTGPGAALDDGGSEESGFSAASDNALLLGVRSSRTPREGQEDESSNKLGVGAGGVSQRWKRAGRMARTVGRLNKVSADVKVFGTSHGMSATNQEKLAEAMAKDERIEHPWYVLLPEKDTFRTVWDVVLLLMLLYVAVALPLRLAFDAFPSVDWHSSMFVFEFLVDVFFMCDVVVNFFTAYYDDGKRQMVTSMRAIAKHYLRTWFIIDIVSSLPLYLIADGNQSNRFGRLARLPKLFRLLRMLKLLRLLRAMRLGPLIDRLQSTLKWRMGFLRIGHFLFLFVCMIHFLTCTWIALAINAPEREDTWLAPDLVDEEDVVIYLAAFYWALSTLTSVGYGDIHAVNSGEFAISIVTMVVGVSFYSFVISNVSSILVRQNQSATEKAREMDTIQAFIREHDLPKELRARILDHAQYRIKKHTATTTGESVKTFIAQLPTQLRIDVTSSIYQPVIDAVPFLKHADAQFVASLVPLLRYVRVPEGSLILHQNWHADEVYFLIKGRAEQVSSDLSRVYRTVVQGSYFGEIPHFIPGILNPNVRALTVCELATVSIQDLRGLLNEYAEVRRYMRRVATARCRRMNAEEEAEQLDPNTAETGAAASVLGSKRNSFEGTLTLVERDIEAKKLEELIAQLQRCQDMQAEDERTLRELAQHMSLRSMRQPRKPRVGGADAADDND